MTMGKIVKFCSECEEGFAEKFGFCPNCGSSLEAFEMNPLQREAAKAEANKAEFVQPEKPAFISSSETERENAFARESENAVAEDFSDDDILELSVEGEETEETISEPETETKVFYSGGNCLFDEREFRSHRLSNIFQCGCDGRRRRFSRYRDRGKKC